MSPTEKILFGILLTALCAMLIQPLSAQEPSTEAAFVRGTLAISGSAWNAEDFGWFYYDLDKDLGGERLSVDLQGRTAEQGHITYSSHVWSSDFEFEPWGKFQSVAFLGKPFFASYPESSFTDAKSSLEKGELRSILINDKKTHIIGYNDSLPLLDGYILAVREISETDGKVNFFLIKDKTLIDVKVVSIGGTYVFKNGNDLPLILIHVSNAMRANTNGTVEIDGVFQISDAPVVKMKDGNKMGNMELVELTDQAIVFKTDKALTLTQNSIVQLADPLLLVVVNDTKLMYYPVGLISDYGHHIIRGPVFNASSIVPIMAGQYSSAVQARWNSINFTGFYFSQDDLIGNEILTLYPPNGRTVPKPGRPEIINGTALWSGFQYVSFLQAKQFDFSPWGDYYVISFLGDLWFAGYNVGASKESDSLNLLEHQKLGKVLIDEEIKGKIVAGNYSLAEGYEFYIRDVKEDKLFIQLLKDGELVDSSIVESNSTYVYKKDLGDVKDMPIIMMHVDRIFSDGQNKFASIDGLFQLSDQYIISVEPGLGLGELEIVPTSFGTLAMWNHEALTLSRNSNLDLWPGMSIRVADNDTLRYYLYKVQYVVPKPTISSMDYSKDITSSKRANFSMTVLAGEIISVSSSINDPNGMTIFKKDLTGLGVGAQNIWEYFWAWNASMLVLSDDKTPVLDADQNPIPGLLYLNSSAKPTLVGIRFDAYGKIASIANSNQIYYVSRSDFNLAKTNMTYDSMLANSTARKQYIKINPGSSQLKFFESINGLYNLSKTNHTISGPIDSLEPHVEHVAARPGRYELELRIENIANALRINGSFFNVTAPEIRGVSIGSNSTPSGKLTIVKLEVPNSNSEKSVVISYNPDQIKAIGASGTSNATSLVDQRSGQIRVVFPPGCSSINLTFSGGQMNATSALQIIKVEGFVPDKVINGSITVMANKNAKQSSAPALTTAIAALSLAAAAARRRKQLIIWRSFESKNPFILYLAFHLALLFLVLFQKLPSWPRSFRDHRHL